MKENFEAALLGMNEKIKEEKEEPLTGAVPEDVEKEIEKFYKEGTLPEGTGEDVYKLQKEKREIVDELHRKLRAVDDGEAVTGFTEGEKREVWWNEKTGKASIKLPNGKWVLATAGDIVTDGEWGLSYKLDKDVPRDIKKKFVVAEARRKVLELADEQIERAEMVREPEPGRRRDVVNAIYRRMLESKERGNQDGVIAEKMIRTFFEKLITDAKLPIGFEAVDVYEDVERKIDFVICVPRRARGIGVEDPEEREDIGIQFTLNDSPETQERKMKQIAHSKSSHVKDRLEVDDIVLVTLPLRSLHASLDDWRDQGEKPGGPMQSWSETRKEDIFRGVLKGLVPEKEITEMWKIIKKG